jgi:hypothetical protein
MTHRLTPPLKNFKSMTLFDNASNWFLEIVLQVGHGSLRVGINDVFAL